ncbi:MAG: hypothetical protein FWG02_09455 [Holophagaceae bacterium]|nr:hypothetical protein [Holophagaceae bacterium]
MFLSIMFVASMPMLGGAEAPADVATPHVIAVAKPTCRLWQLLEGPPDAPRFWVSWDGGVPQSFYTETAARAYMKEHCDNSEDEPEDIIF